MQKDEEVGKVAQATPVVICELCTVLFDRQSFNRTLPSHIRAPSNWPVLCDITTARTAKALELFLAMIVEEASNVTVDRGSKRVEAYHLYVLVHARMSHI